MGHIRFKGIGRFGSSRDHYFFSPSELNPLLMSQKTTRAIFLRVHAAVGGGQGGQTHRQCLEATAMDMSMCKEIVEQNCNKSSIV